jgi:hypothetical protein
LRVEVRRREWAIAAGLLCAVLAIYELNGDFLPGNDATPNLYLTANILDGGGLAFAPSRWPSMFLWADQDGTRVVRKEKYYLVPSQRVDAASGEAQYPGAFGIGAGLTAFPFLVAAKPFVDLHRGTPAMWQLGKFVAALLVAGSALFVFLAALEFLPLAIALAIALAYALGTCVFSVSSQSLWQHGPNTFFLALGLYAFLRAPGRPKMAALAGAALSCAVACRPTSAIVFAMVALQLAGEGRRELIAFALAALPAALGLAAFNWSYFGSPFSFSQMQMAHAVALQKTGNEDVWQTPIVSGLAGLLLSPSRGLLVYSPFLAFAGAGVWRAWKQADWKRLRPLSIAALIVLLVESKHFDWWGGWSFGYRHIVDLVPILSLLLLPVAKWVWERKPWRVTFAALAIWSFGVQLLGAWAYDVAGWNARIENGVKMDVDKREWRDRLWSWSDNPISYYATHFGEAREAKHALMTKSLGAR